MAQSAEFVTVGLPGNQPDPANPQQPGVGQVGYLYRISRTEVTNAQYVAFLNAVDPDGLNALGLFDTRMGSNAQGGIAQWPNRPLGQRYAVRPDMADKPVNYVSLADAARYCNWLHNGQGSGSTAGGAYSLAGGMVGPRQPGATFFLPNDNEWYKAAYFDPQRDAAGLFDYWAYATRSDLTPTPALADLIGNVSNPAGNVANYQSGASWGSGTRLTTVATAQSASYFGTFDQNGNVAEWIEFIDADSGLRATRGGGYSASADELSAPSRTLQPSTAAGPTIGFRIAASATGGTQPPTLISVRSRKEHG